MKISLKIFIFSYCLLVLVTVAGGFVIVHSLYRTDFNESMEAALEDTETLTGYLSILMELPDNNYREYMQTGLSDRMSENQVFIGSFAEWKKRIRLQGYRSLPEGKIIAGVIDDGTKKIQTASHLKDVYILNHYDIADIFQRRDANYQVYRQVIILCSVVIAIVLYLFSLYITRPLVKVTRMAEAISEGNYSIRMKTDYRRMKSYEVAKLGETLNQLSSNTRSHIRELEDMVRKREDFMGNFTHEIKTPLTSIIGYADLLRTYDLKPDKKREYASFIYNEGKRLEQLSLNLLQLIVMEHTDFPMVRLNTTWLFDSLKEAVRFLGEKYKVKIRLSCVQAEVYAEPSLLTTAVTNLIDNACKASEAGGSVILRGQRKDDRFCFLVIDNGRGIPEDELEKIMEPFYMVDKSRARSQGGAGLGLALCQKIAALHQGELQIKSVPGKGTAASLLIPVAEGGGADEEAI